MRQLRFAIRTLARHRSYAALAIVTLGLTVGANIVVFSIARGLLLRPLPIADPGRVYFLMHGSLYTTSFPAYRDLRARTRTFSDLAAYRIAPMALSTDGESRRVWGYLATGNYFSMLGVRPAAGRLFTAADEGAPGAAPLAVLSYAFWQRAFNSDAAVIGRTIRINDRPYSVIGVAPREFIGTEVFYRPDLWVPMSMQGQIEGRSWLDDRGPKNTMVVGRLAPQVTTAAALGDLDAIGRALAREHPRTDAREPFALTRPGLFGGAVRGMTATLVSGVMLIAVLALLAACANLGGLLASRALDRTRDIGVRLAIGASRLELLREIAIETLLLASLGSIVGYVVAQIVLRLVSGWAPLDLPFQVDVMPDASVVLFAATITLAAAALASIASIRRAWSVDVATLVAWRPAIAIGRHRWSGREWLLIAQVAVCSVLLMAATVAVQSVRAASRAPIGLSPEHLTLVMADLGLFGYSRDAALTFDTRLLDTVAHLPGVTRAALSTSIPMSVDQSTTAVWRALEPAQRPSRSFEAYYYYVSPGYFATVGTRLVAGRDFDDHDDRTRGSVAIVNATFARRVIGTADAVGRTFRSNNREVEIIGVVEDGKYRSLTESPQLAVFRPRRQVNDTNVTVLVRSDLPADRIVPQVRAAIAALDARVPVLYEGPVSGVMSLAFLPSNAAGIALTAFGLIAVVLAITGVYSLAAFAVSRRTREIGIRVAIGARRHHVLSAVLGRMAVCVIAGGGIGVVAGTIASQFLAAVIYKAVPGDPAVITIVVLLMAAVAVTAALAPMRRALSIEPAVALREG